ncbi:hypothetical protein ACA910_007818 [Epithemia clementina (nom. ined.)]
MNISQTLLLLLLQCLACSPFLLPHSNQGLDRSRRRIYFQHVDRDLSRPFVPRNNHKKVQSFLVLRSSSNNNNNINNERSQEEDDNDKQQAGLNELHTKLRDAVAEQNFVEAGRISDILLYQLHSDLLPTTNGSNSNNNNNNNNISPKERQEKIKLARKRMSWKGLGAAPWLIHRLDSLNFTFPTTIQINAMEAVNAILQQQQQQQQQTQNYIYNDMDSSLEERVSRSNLDMGIVISGTTGSGKSLAYLVPLLSTLSDSLFNRQRIRVGAEEMVGDTTGDLLDRLAIVTSPVIRSSARSQVRSSSTIATGAALSTLGSSGTNVRSPLALIVVPSRELGIQIAMVLYQLVGGNIKDNPLVLDASSSRANMFKYKGPKGVRIGCVLDDEDAAFGLKLQTDVAITMPQYLGKLLDDGDIEAAQLRVVVYDEADLGLEQTSTSTLKALFEDTSPEQPNDDYHDDDEDKDDDDEPQRREYSRLTFLVGASVTEALGNLAVSSRILPSGRSYIATATRFAPLLSDEGDAGCTSSHGDDFLLLEPKASLQDLNLCLYPGLKHQRATVENDEGLLVLTRLLRKELREYEQKNSQDRPRVVIFFPSEEEARAALEPLRDALWGEHRLCVLLPKTGVSPLTILDQFRRNETSVMLATPNSVRGLDVKGLTHVYTLYLPMNDPREYVHLAGRVGRVGQAPTSQNGGNVISILRRNETNQMNELAKQLGFEFAEIDSEALQRPVFVKQQPKDPTRSVSPSSSDDDDDDDDVDLVIESDDVESMRRYLEDSITFLKLAEDPSAVQQGASAVKSSSNNSSITDFEDTDEDHDGIGSLKSN